MKSLAFIVTSCVVSSVSTGCVGPKPYPGDVWADSTTKPKDVKVIVADVPPQPVVDAVPVETAPADAIAALPDAQLPPVPDIAVPPVTADTQPIVVVDAQPEPDVVIVTPSDVMDIVWPTITTDVVVPPLTKDTGSTWVQIDTTTTPPDTGPPPPVPDVSVAVDTGPPNLPDVTPPVDIAPVAVVDVVPTVDTAPVLVPDVGPPADTVSVVGADIVQPADTTTQPAPTGLVYGMTLDAVDNLAAIVDALKSLPVKPWVRIVFDYPLLPSDYTAAVAAIAPYAVIVGQPSDSTYNAKMTVDQYRARFQAYVDQLPQIDIWETCNECNGDWLGPNASAQADAATDVVKSAGKKALFTPYWNTNTCADTHGPYVAWIAKNISAAVKTESDYVTPSIYGFDCDGPEPAYSELDSMVQTFAAMFPNAQVGIGEYGKQGDATILKYYLGYPNPNPRYVFAGLYWYGKQDFVPKTKPLWPIFAAGMK